MKRTIVFIELDVDPDALTEEPESPEADTLLDQLAQKLRTIIDDLNLDVTAAVVDEGRVEDYVPYPGLHQLDL